MAMDATPMLKRKGAEAPEPWLDGVPVPATKIRRLLRRGGAACRARRRGRAASAAAAFRDGGGADEGRGGAGFRRAGGERGARDRGRNLLRGPLRPEAPLRISPDCIRGIKSTVLQEASNHRALFEEQASRDENPNLAMVPWAPLTTTTSSAPATGMMDADDASMEVEQDGVGQPAPPAGFVLQGQAFHQELQWPPQHCMATHQLQVLSIR